MRKFNINGRKEVWPGNTKNTKKQHREYKRFTKGTKEHKWKESRGKCESCNKKIKHKKEAHFHHKMALAYAFHYFPWIPAEALRDKKNCQVLCEDCHKNIHRDESLLIYSIMAANFVRFIDKNKKKTPS